VSARLAIGVTEGIPSNVGHCPLSETSFGRPTLATSSTDAEDIKCGARAG
jgi:hypothetical protein